MKGFPQDPRPLLTSDEKKKILTLIASEGAVAAEKFNGYVEDLVIGQSIHAALGLKDRLYAPNLMVLLAKGVNGIQEEVDALATELDDNGAESLKGWLHYIRFEKTTEKMYEQGIRDQGREGRDLCSFLQHSSAKKAQLSESHVVALRLYTSPVFRYINDPLRDQHRYEEKKACLLPATTFWADEAIKQLRAINSDLPLGTPTTLWRGMQNRKVDPGFLLRGGTELAFLSTTSDLHVAVRYSLSRASLFYKVIASNFLSAGVDVEWISVFPSEREKVYPPLTFLEPTGRSECLSAVREGKDLTITIVEVRPTIC